MAIPIFKTFSTIVSETLTAIGERTNLTNFNVGGTIRTITEVFSEVVGELYAYGSDMLKQGFMATAQGAWLINKVKEVGVEPKDVITTEGTVMFSRPTARDTNITIPVDSIVATKKDQSGKEYRYFTTQEVILPAGSISVAVPVIAENPGSAYNVGAGSITVMKTYINGISAVTNRPDWITTVGVDEESDEELRSRGFLAWEELSQGGIAAAYISWAKAVTGVVSAFVDDNLPRGEGTIDVYILGQSGPPDTALIKAAQLHINDQVPIGADPLVRAPGIVTVNMDLIITPKAKYDTVSMDAEIRRRLSVLFGDIQDASLDITPLGVGNDVVVARIIDVVMDVPGVYSVSVLSPASDVVVAINEYPELGTVTLTMKAASNE